MRSTLNSTRGTLIRMMLTRMVSTLSVCALALVLFVVGCQEGKKPSVAHEQVHAFNNGIYLIHQSFNSDKEIRASARGRRILLFDEKHLGKGKIEVDRSANVPLLLGKRPETLKRDDGKLQLTITLDPKHTKRLAAFTRTHLNRRIALIIGGKVISMHKIKAEITGGRMQISYCLENDCSFLLTELNKGMDALKPQ